MGPAQWHGELIADPLSRRICVGSPDGGRQWPWKNKCLAIGSVSQERAEAARAQRDGDHSREILSTYFRDVPVPDLLPVAGNAKVAGFHP
jgi:hypothetical protein